MPLSAPCGEQSYILRLGDGGYNDATKTPNPPGSALAAPLGLEQPCQYTLNDGQIYLRAVFEPSADPNAAPVRVTEAALYTSANELVFIETFRPLWLERGMKLEFLYRLGEGVTGGVEVYPRNGAAEGFAPEVSKTMGPTEIGVTAGGFSTLFSTPYAVTKTEGTVKLYRQGPTGWAYVQDIPTNNSTYQHISLCFDQAAQPVLAYEVPGSPSSIYVRQYDPLSSGYVYRGPFVGVDPVVFNDAITLQTTADSDVLLLYLSPNRQTLYMRAQRDQYSIEYTLETFPAPVTLDIVTQVGYQWQAEGYLLNVRSDLYPVQDKDSLAPIALQAPEDWEYDPLVIEPSLPDDTLEPMAVDPPLGWDYIPTTVIRTLPDDTLDSMTIDPPLGWTYSVVVVVQTLPDDTLDSMTIDPPLGWTYSVVVVVQTLPDDTLDSMTISPPLNWSYDLP